MKSRKLRILIGFFFIVIFTVPLFPQAKYHDYSAAGIRILVPQDWIAKERALLTLTTPEEDYCIIVQLTGADNLDRAVKESLIELKAMYPKDTEYNINDIVINGMNAKEIGKSFEKNRIDYYMIQTSSGKVVKLFAITKKEIALKYRKDLEKIVASINGI